MHMWYTVLDHNDWTNAKTTFLIGKIKVMNGKYTVILQNIPGSHAEEVLIGKLKRMSETVRYITLYLNNSPCSRCANLLMDYLDNNEDVQLTVYVTCLYMVKRKSCEKLGHSKCISKENKNIDELSTLKNHARCKIEGFRKENWIELLNLMKMSDKFKERLLETYSISPVRSREEEDENIRSDLRDI